MEELADNGHALRYAPEELRGDREVVIKAVSQNGRALQHATEELRGDGEVVMKAVSQDGVALFYAAEELRGDREVVMKAVSQYGGALRYATEELRGDREGCDESSVPIWDGSGLRLQKSWEGDREVVMKAVSQYASTLQYATEELKGDREVVMKAVSRNGMALEHATEALRGDQELMEAALAKAPYGVGLSVRLMSGRCCNQICHQSTPLSAVLRRCAKLLDMDSEHVQKCGTLMSGTVVIANLGSLKFGKMHELTLVLA